MTFRRTGPILLCLALAGCGFFSRPKNQFYSLDTIPAAGAPRSIAGAPIGVDGIELPPGLDRRGIFVRGADSKIEVRGTHQWVSPLEEMVIHTLAFDLANRLPNGMVIVPGQARPAGVMRGLSVTFEELAPGPDPVFVLDARWTLNEPGRPQRSGHERISIPLTSMESPAIVAGFNQALATLADRIVAAL